MFEIVCTGRGYIVATPGDAERYIADALHVEADPRLEQPVFANDREAAKAAERDGFRLIYGMEDVPDGLYIDTPRNREVIRLMLMLFPGYVTLYRLRRDRPDAAV